MGLITVNFGVSRYGLYEGREFWESVLVEAHGMILDIFILGVVVLLLLNRFEKKREISELHSKIEFNRHIKSEDAKYNIISAIGLLNKVNQTKFDLHQCDLSGLIMTKANLSGSSIHAAKFLNTNLKDSNFTKINGERSIFNKATLNNVNFNSSRLYRADFTNTKARSIHLNNCEIIRTNFCDSDLNNSDFRNSKLDTISFERAILKNSDFRKCEFGKDISFVDADLQSSDFRDSINIPIADILKAKCFIKAKFDDNVLIELKNLKADLLI